MDFKPIHRQNNVTLEHINFHFIIEMPRQVTYHHVFENVNRASNNCENHTKTHEQSKNQSAANLDGVIANQTDKGIRERQHS